MQQQLDGKTGPYQGWFMGKRRDGGWHWTDDGKKSLCGMVRSVERQAPFRIPRGDTWCHSCRRIMVNRGINIK